MANKVDKYIQKGGNERPLLDSENLDIIMDYIKAAVDPIQRTTNKYFVIMYGPPGSGKSIGKKIACHLINETFNEDKSVDEILSTFIDSEVDSIVEDILIKDEDLTFLNNNLKKLNEDEDEPGQDEDEDEGELDQDELRQIKAKEIMKLYLHKIIQIKSDQSITLDNIEDEENRINVVKELQENSDTWDIPGESFKINNLILRKKYNLDALSESLMYMAAFLGKNVFMEIATADLSYIYKIWSSFKYYGYIPIIIYPFVNDVNILHKRVINRGLNIGRFIACNNENYGLDKIMQNNIERFQTEKITMWEGAEELDGIIHYFTNSVNLNNYLTLIYRYDSIFSEDEMNQMNNNNFDFLSNKNPLRITYNTEIENFKISYEDQNIITECNYLKKDEDEEKN